jgi:hypothetical protein
VLGKTPLPPSSAAFHRHATTGTGVAGTEDR